LKAVVFLLVTAVVLYPRVWLLPTAFDRYRDMNSVLDPTHPELAPLEARVRDSLPPEAEGGDALVAVEKVVCERIPYAWDWEVWGVCDYLPTVAEVFQQGREDCDGRAVVAASLLRRMGYEAWLVSDVLHAWVVTPEGETMSPTGAEKTLVATDEGTQTVISLQLIRNLARGLSYGVAVFPLARELIILVTLCLLAMQPASSAWRRVGGCVVLLAALVALRVGGRTAVVDRRVFEVICTWLGVALAVGGCLLLAVRGGRRHPRSGATRSE
jgi:hypothetical protein